MISMELLRKEMEEEFIRNGLTKRALELSQKLDMLIAKEQRSRLEDGRIA